jgi:hypothetical protein
MSKSEIPESVILEMQKRVYEVRDKEIPDTLDRLKKAKKALDEAQIAYDYVSLTVLRDIIKFLQEYNPDAIDKDSSWWEELGIPEVPNLQYACYNCVHCGMGDCGDLNIFRNTIGSFMDNRQSHQSGGGYDSDFYKLLFSFAEIIAPRCNGYEQMKDIDEKKIL